MATPGNFFDQFDEPTPIQQRQTAAEERANAAERRAEAASGRAASAENRAAAEFETKYNMRPAPGDTTKTGEEYLKTIEPSLAAQVRAIAEGRRAFPTGLGLKSPQAQELVAAATQYDPTIDAANAATRIATRKDFTSGKAAQNITSLNTAIGHLNTLRKSARELGNVDFQPFNTFGNYLRTKTGDPRVRNFNIARQAVASELTRAFRGTGGSMTEVKDWENSLNSSDSPDQLEGAIQQATELLQSRLDAMQQQYQQGMGRSADIMQFITPKNQKLLTELSVGAQPEGAQAADVFTGAPAGSVIAPEDIKGWRYSPESQQKLLSYLRDPGATPEGYAKLATDAAVAEGHVTPEQRDDYLARNVEGYRDYFSQTTPEQRAKVNSLDYSGIDKAATENAGLGASVAQGLRNVPESAAQLAEGLVALPASAIASVGEGRPVGATGSLLQLAGEMGSGPATEALKGSLAERYGDLKRTAIRDPLGLAADVSIPLTLGGSALERAPGLLGDIGSLTKTTGRVIDPLSATGALATEVAPAMAKYAQAKVPGMFRGLAAAPAELAGFPSGAGGAAIREAFGAGRERGLAGAPTPRSEALTGGMRNPGEHVEDVVSVARDAVSNLREQASNRYATAMQQFGATPAPLPMGTVLTRLARLKPRNYDAMLAAPRRPSDHVAWEQMMDTVQHYAAQAAQDPSLLEPLAMDAFKQDLYDVGSKIGGAYDRDAARIAGTAYNAVRQELVKHDPIYAKIMKDYETAAKEAQQIEASFSLGAARGKSPNIDAATRRLQSIMRNNANTNYGQRSAQGARLASLDTTGTMMPTLAGQTLSAIPPRGLQSLGAIGAGVTTAVTNPSALPALAAFSPRVAGEMAYGAGRGVGTLQRGAQAAADLSLPTAQNLADLYNRYPTASLATSQGANRLEDTPDELARRYGADSMSIPTFYGDGGF